MRHSPKYISEFLPKIPILFLTIICQSIYSPIIIMLAQQTQINIANPLPIHAYKSQIISTVKTSPVTLVCGQTGSGKTTQVPQFLYPHFNRIIVSQPRRISAITLAQRVAFQMGHQIGKQIGYNVRFEEKRSADTKVVFATDGMAIRELMMGFSYDLFILDQAHERSINTDVLMAILKRKLATHRKGQKPFKLIIMSATIQSSKFMQFYNTDALITIEGRSYETEMYNLLEPVESYYEAVFNAVMQIHFTDPPGDILVFLTGEDEIVGLQKRLQKTKRDFNIGQLEVLMLYSALPHEYQHHVFERKPGHQLRRVILSTNIAETSVTIPGVRYVVDCGFIKVRTFDNHRMLDMLTVIPVSKANALQRAGRAGREAAGKCYQLYPKNTFEQLKQHNLPEILRSQLSGPILQLKAIGIGNILELQFMDQPPLETFKQCLAVLRQIGCLTAEPAEQITEYGKEVSRLPLPPRLAHLLLLSMDFKCESMMLSLLSILSIENMFVSSAVAQKGNRKSNLQEVLTRFLPVCSGSVLFTGKGPVNNRLLTSDHLAKVNLLHQYIRVQNKTLFCQQNFINKNNIKRAVLVRQQLADYLLQIIKERQKKDFFVIGVQGNKLNTQIHKESLDSSSIQNWIKCMSKGCLYSTARLSKDGRYKIYRSGQEAFIHPESLVFYLAQKPQTIVFSQIVKTSKVYLKDVTPLPEGQMQTLSK